LKESWRTETKRVGVEAEDEQGEDEDEPTVWEDAREVLDNPQEGTELQEEQPVRVIEPAVNTPSTIRRRGSGWGRSKEVRNVQAADDKEVQERDDRAHDVFTKRALQQSSLRKRVNPFAGLENAEAKVTDEGDVVMLDA